MPVMINLVSTRPREVSQDEDYIAIISDRSATTRSSTLRANVNDFHSRLVS